MNDPAWLVRELVWYERCTERLAGSRQVPGLSTADICRLWCREHGDPMLDSLPLGPEQAAFVAALVQVDIDCGTTTISWNRAQATGTAPWPMEALWGNIPHPVASWSRID